MNFGVNRTDYYADYDVNTFYSIANLQQRITKLFVNADLLDAAVFWFTNIERKRHNLKQFRFHDKLRQTAALHSEQMKIHNFFDHENAFDARYATLTDRIESVKDSSFQGFMSWGENIAYQGKEPFEYSYCEFAKTVVGGWMNSPGHRANILNPDFEYLGCGCAKYEQKGNGYSMLCFKLTQNFGGSLVSNGFLFDVEKIINNIKNRINANQGLKRPFFYVIFLLKFSKKSCIYR